MKQGSVARLTAVREGAETRLSRAFAAAPQRWTWGRGSDDGFLAVSHQLLGDGAFAGDSARITVAAAESARLVVRGLACTPLRCGSSRSVVRLAVASGACVLYLPGALVPHAGASHESSLQIRADQGSVVLAATVLAPGRTGMGERGVFGRLRFRTQATYAGQLAFAEDAEVRGCELAEAPFGAFVTLTALGERWPADPAAWQRCAAGGGLLAASRLRLGGVAVRGMFHTLGDAQSFVGEVERRVRTSGQALAC